MKFNIFKFSLIYLLVDLVFLKPAYAYLGLGPLIPVIGNIIVYIFLFIISIIGMVVYPIKILLKIKKKNKKRKSLRK